MKRMVENSEKIEELAEAVENSETTLTFKKQVNFDGNVNVHGVTRAYNGLEVNNDKDFVTSNITTPDGYRLYIFKESDYYNLNSTKFNSLFVFNLGTALIVNGDYDPGNGNGDVNVMTIKSNALMASNLDVQMLSNGGEIYATYSDNADGTKTIIINFDSTRADVPKSNYPFSFIIGKAFKQI